MADYRVTLNGLMLGQVHQNVLHVIVPDGGVSPEQVAASFRDVWLVQIRLRVMAMLVWNLITVQPLGPGTQPAATQLAINIAGNATNDASTYPFVTTVLQFKTGIAGKHGQGRMYLSGTTPGSMANGIVTAATVAGWAPVLTALKNAYASSSPSSGFSLAIAERIPGSAPVLRSVIDIVLRAHAGCQRRRNYFMGV